MRKLLLILTIALVLSSFGCVKTTYIGRAGRIKTKYELRAKVQKRDARYQYLTGCTRKWQLQVLKKELDLTVLTFVKAKIFDLISYPAMVVGVTSEGDTVRVLQYRFKEDINRGERIVIVPDTNKYVGDPISIALMNYPVELAKNEQEDSLYCQVAKTYMGIINKTVFR